MALQPACAAKGPWTHIRHEIGYTISPTDGDTLSSRPVTVFDIAVFVPDKADLQKAALMMNRFANVLHESTNGAHFLGQVTYVFDTSLVIRNQVDVVLIPYVRSFATLDGLLSADYQTDPASSSVLKQATCIRLGYDASSGAWIKEAIVLAHEWGHYAYGLPDEYYQSGMEVLPSDYNEFQNRYQSVPSLMMLGGSSTDPVQWNFSSRWNIRTNPLGETIPDAKIVNDTMHFHRSFAGYSNMSAWDYLARDSLGWFFNDARINYGHYYPEFRTPGVAPSSTDSASVVFLGDTLRVGGVRVEQYGAFVANVLPTAFLKHQVGMDSLMEPMHALLFDGASMDAALRSRAAFLASQMNLANHLPDTARFKHRLAVYALRKNNADLGLYTLQEPVPINDAANHLDEPSTYENYNANWNTKVANVSEALWKIVRRLKQDEDSLAKIWTAYHEDACDGISWKAGRATRLVVLTAGGTLVGLDSLRLALQNFDVELDVVAVGTNSQGLQDWRVLGQELGMFMNLGDLDFSADSWGGAFGRARWASLGNLNGIDPEGGLAGKVGPQSLTKFLSRSQALNSRILFTVRDTALVQKKYFLKGQIADLAGQCDTVRYGKSQTSSCWLARNGQVLFDSLWFNNQSKDQSFINRLSLTFDSPPYMGSGSLVVGGSETGILSSTAKSYAKGASFSPVPGYSVAGLTVWAYVVDAAGVIQDTLVMNDMGTAGDTYVADGVYTGFSAKNLAVGDYDIFLELSGDSVLQTTEVITGYAPSDIVVVPETFSLTLDQLQQSTSAGYLRVEHSALDEADWCSASSDTLSAAQRRLAGRMDYAQDQDCFVLKGDGSPRVLRLGELLGPEPDISWRDAQGNELLDSSLLPLQSAMGYRYWQLSPWLLNKGLQVVVRAADSLAKAGSYTLVLDTATIADKSRHIASLQSADFAGAGANYTGLAVKVRNLSGDTLRDFRIRYYFNTEYFAEPQVSDWWSAFCSAKRVRLGPELWAVELDYAGTALAPGASLQIDPDNAIGVHYGDWRSWNATNDWSWHPGLGFQENPRLVLLNSAGTVLQGELPSDSLYAGRTRIQSVVPHVREEQSAGANWSAPRFQLENVGDSVANPLVFYYFHEQGELSLPVAWQCTHCTVRLDSLGGGDWRLVLDYAGYTLPANNSMWEAEAYVGLRHTDWSPWNHADDVPRTEVRNAQGELLGSLGGTP